MTHLVQQSSRIPQSMDLYARALELIPGATQLISRRPTRFALGVSPVYAERAKGARFWDVDGNEYIDWVSGIGAVILGYADPVVDEAVIEQIRLGTMYSINHELEIEVAEALTSLLPGAEMVRYAKGGGDACAIAVRIARGVTGRDKVLFCGYHGWHDWYLAANLTAGANLNSHLFPGIEPLGVPTGLAGTSHPFPYGDLQALRQQLEAHRGEVAAVMMEPLRSAEPPPGYLAAVAELTREHGAALIFDEVSSGFRFGPAAAQGYVGVVPDMSVFAKSMSNGYPMGAVVGKREWMEPSARMFISSTYWSDTIGLRATLTTLQELRNRHVSEQLWAFGGRLQQQLNEVAERLEAPVHCQGLAIHPHLHFQVEDPLLHRKVVTLYIQEMAKRGCHGYASFYLNAAQGEPELQQTVGAAEETFALITSGLREHRIDELLECDLQQEYFRRLVS
jgi:glutamate-1-semialdehyde 2,1-aminomutase